jgi:hypothetical protein
MDQDTLKRQLLETYLRQQGNAQQRGGQALTPAQISQIQAIQSMQPMQLQQHTQQQHTQQQHTQQQHTQPPSVSAASTSTKAREIVRYEVPDENNITLEEFKEYVKKWIELDNTIKRAQEAIKERKQARDKLSMLISKFMCKYDIEDLNTKEGRIRCKVMQVKAPVSQKVVKQKIIDYFQNDENKKEEIISKIYNERETVQKVSLRRLKIS